jgi:hypothetical protein
MVSAARIGDIGRFPSQDHCRLTGRLRIGKSRSQFITSPRLERFGQW